MQFYATSTRFSANSKQIRSNVTRFCAIVIPQDAKLSMAPFQYSSLHVLVVLPLSFPLHVVLNTILKGCFITLIAQVKRVR